jgi:branched-chain amino acid aminotransferase
MKYSIKVTRTRKSNLANVDFSSLVFGNTFSDHVFIADYDGSSWTDLRIVPFKEFSITPANMALHYGQTAFEGMKATLTKEGVPCLFRPEMHARRLNASCDRLCMPQVPEDLFLEGLKKLVSVDIDWIPNNPDSSLYIRPLIFATDNFVGVRISTTYRFIIMTCPVGAYYSKAVRLLADDFHVRAVVGGTGEAKAAGNYAGALLPTKLANQKGYDQIMWLDATHHKFVQEVGTMNLFFVINGVVVTPATDGAILKGITRNSFLTILKKKGYKAEERPVSIDEIVAASKNGTLQEVFGAGTAAVVTPVAAIVYKDYVMAVPPLTQNSIGTMLKAEIVGIRAGTIKDTYKFLVPIKRAVKKTVLA